MADQLEIGKMNLEPWYAIPQLKAVRIITGTGAHNFGYGSNEIAICKQLKADHPSVNCEVYDHDIINVDGVEIDLAHHGPFPGSRNWLRGNVARLYLQDLMLNDLDHGKVPPRLIMRAHFHQYIPPVDYRIERNGKEYMSTLVICPSFTFVDAFTRQVAKSPAYVTHGMIVVEIVNGKVTETVPMKRSIDIRTREIL
jgi:hypothetical protein